MEWCGCDLKQKIYTNVVTPPKKDYLLCQFRLIESTWIPAFAHWHQANGCLSNRYSNLGKTTGCHSEGATRSVFYWVEKNMIVDMQIETTVTDESPVSSYNEQQC